MLFFFCLVLFSRFGFFLFKWTADLANLTLSSSISVLVIFFTYLKPFWLVCHCLVQVRTQSYVEMNIFHKRWEDAVNEDRCWVDPYQQFANQTRYWTVFIKWMLMLTHFLGEARRSLNSQVSGGSKSCDQWLEGMRRMFRKPALKEIIAMLWFFGLYLPQLKKKWEIHPLCQLLVSIDRGLIL